MAPKKKVMKPTKEKKLTIQIDEGVDVSLDFVPSSSGTPDPNPPDPTQEETPPSPGYKKSFRWNAAGCS